MIYVTVAALGLAFCVLAASLGFVRWSLRQLERKDRQVADFADRAMHTINKTWEPPPYARGADEQVDERERARAAMFEGIIEDPEQTIDYPHARPARIGYPEEILADTPSVPPHTFAPADSDIV